MSDTTVYVIGAGCSVKYGYPLAANFVPAFKSFSHSLDSDSPKLKQSVDETVLLMQEANVQTVDELVFRIHNGALDDPKHSPTQGYGLRLRRILKAKIATVALFLALEHRAKSESLDSYQRLILKIFPGSGDWRQRFRNARCHLLTFNYDRLFEMALLRMFGIDADTQLLYGEDILNSGLHHCMGESMGFTNDRFCFLKLHGSVGMRIHEEYGQPCYYPYLDGAKPGEKIELNDARFFAKSANPLPQDRDPEPLIVFPFEKDFVRSGSPNQLAFREYITAVWQQAERVLEPASEIWFIGYSFAMMDRTAVIALLARARHCKRLVIQNRPGEAEQICRILAVEHPELGNLLEPYACDF
jgi:hypothetical protein